MSFRVMGGYWGCVRTFWHVDAFHFRNNFQWSVWYCEAWRSLKIFLYVVWLGSGICFKTVSKSCYFRTTTTLTQKTNLIRGVSVISTSTNFDLPLKIFSVMKISRQWTIFCLNFHGKLQCTTLFDGNPLNVWFHVAQSANNPQEKIISSDEAKNEP